VAGGTGFLWEINGTDGTLRITADAAYPEIYPLTVAGAHGRNEPAELAVPAALTQKWPALTSLEGAPRLQRRACLRRVRGRHRQRDSHRAGLRRRRPAPRGHRRHRELRGIRGTREGVARCAETSVRAASSAPGCGTPLGACWARRVPPPQSGLRRSACVRDSVHLFGGRRRLRWAGGTVGWVGPAGRSAK
jgi:hypothetical protein